MKFLVRIRGAVCWDFGAHFGIHTVGMARQVGPEGQVAAFEPDPVAFARLAYHVRANGLTNVELFQAAASNSDEQRRMIPHGGLGSTMSHFRYPGEVEPHDGSTFPVESRVPDSLVAAGRIRLPDLIKVDVQGHGAEALLGSSHSIRAKLPVIIFSSHSPAELNGTQALLEPLGYVVSGLEGAAMDWEELESATGILRPRSEK
ncbi:MAG: FkbM family methyltransferase [Thermoanaerobaculia bacterium]